MNEKKQSKPGPKVRLDSLIVERGLAASRERARALVMAGKVLVNAAPSPKAGTKISPDSEISLIEKDIPYVSRGGVKLAGALDEFGVDVAGLTAIDVGASTGGFSDCLLQRGAKKVFAVDVGYGLIDLKIRNDPRVTLFEKTNFRYFDPQLIEEPVDIGVVDVSFISIKLILPVLDRILTEGGQIVSLVKPQFEVGRREVGKGGIVRDQEKAQKTIDELEMFARELGFDLLGKSRSVITGAKGNVEYFFHLRK